VTDTVALPPVGDGSRRNRRKAPPPRRQRPPRRALPIRQILLAVLAVVVAAVAVAGAMSILGDDDAGEPTTPTTAGRIEVTSSRLLLERDASRDLIGAAVVVAWRGGAGAVLSIPPGTMLETPGLGLAPLREAASGGDDLALVTVENLLGVRIDQVAGVDPADWSAAVGAFPDGTKVALPVSPLGGADELFKVDNDRLDAVVARVLQAPRRASRITVQVLNGTRKPGVAASVVPALVAAGARVSLTGNADADYATTQVVYYSDDAADEAARVQRALGVGQVVRSTVGIGAVQVTVVVGADFGASSRGTPSTTEGATP